MNVIPQGVKDGFAQGVLPLSRALLRAQVSPNAITTVGFFVFLGSAAAFAAGYVRLGAFLLLCCGLVDVLDGQVARQGGMVTAFGGFYDSTLDRVGEGALFTGIALFFLRGGVPPALQAPAVALTMVAVVASLLVSYTRARAEALGFDCKVGLAARAERVFALGFPPLVFGAGPEGRLLFWIIALLALASAVTVVQRVLHVARMTRGAAPAPPHRA